MTNDRHDQPTTPTPGGTAAARPGAADHQVDAHLVPSAADRLRQRVAEAQRVADGPPITDDSAEGFDLLVAMGCECVSHHGCTAHTPSGESYGPFKSWASAEAVVSGPERWALRAGERVDLLNGSRVDAEAAGTLAIRVSAPALGLPETFRFVSLDATAADFLANLADALDDMRESA